ncbi:hypothetical protein MUGA111182_00685 [Mucilaginibacter galii]|uniref:hypothetical protein n=1 Tax=Mucilaginibacter galii TaxID=2005073 RepID=UPI00166C041B|nr:hypothetical protein [Mucilaginibacter galii]
MQYLKAKYLFLLSGIISFVVGVIYYHDTLDMNLHDTYFVAVLPLLSCYPAIYMLMVAMVYFMFSRYFKPLNERAGTVHFLVTALSAISMWQIFNTFFQPKRYYAFNGPSYFITAENMLLVAFFFFLVAQLLFVINIIRTVIMFRSTNPEL